MTIRIFFFFVFSFSVFYCSAFFCSFCSPARPDQCGMIWHMALARIRSNRNMEPASRTVGAIIGTGVRVFEAALPTDSFSWVSWLAVRLLSPFSAILCFVIYCNGWAGVCSTLFMGWYGIKFVVVVFLRRLAGRGRCSVKAPPNCNWTPVHVLNGKSKPVSRTAGGPYNRDVCLSRLWPWQWCSVHEAKR